MSTQLNFFDPVPMTPPRRSAKAKAQPRAKRTQANAKPSKEIPLNPTAPKEGADRFNEQHHKILALLRHGPVTSNELSKIAKRYGARLGEIRAAGFVIPFPKTLDAKAGIYLYTLVSEPEAQTEAA